MIIQNAVRILTPDNQEIFLRSVGVHDFRCYNFNDGTFFAVDGGKEYIRRVGRIPDGYGYEDWSLDDSHPFDIICQRLLWGARGDDGKPRLVPISTLTVDHLRNILRDYADKLSPVQLSVIERFIKEKAQ